jgi:transcription antitermination factor NusG
MEMAAGETGNMAQVREALQGITGVESKPIILGPDRYLIIVRPNHEFDAVDSFRRNNVRAYWPNYEELMPTQHRHNGHPVRRMRRVGILPGYVFSPVDHDQDFMGLIERIVGVIDVARTFSGNALLVNEADIQIIRKIEIGLNTPEPVKTAHKFKTGEKVRFSDDLSGRWPSGKITKLARDGRIKVEVEMMGRKVEITVFPHQIERV